MKILNVILVVILSFLIVGCDDDPDEVAQYTTEGNHKIDKVLWLVNQQVKYPKQDEFSIRSAVDYKSIKVTKSGRELLPNEANVEYKEKMEYSSPLGLISSDLNYSDKDYVILLTFKNSYWTYDHKQATLNVCNYTLKKLNKENILYGFNVNSQDIVKRNQKGMNDPINFNNICSNYLDNRDNTFYLAFLVH